MKDPGAHDLTRPAFRADVAQATSNPPDNPAASLHETLTSMLNGAANSSGLSGDKWHWIRPILRQPIPGPTYPGYLRDSDKATFENYWQFINNLAPPQQYDKDKDSSPTLLSLSQKTYDAETSRRDSINGRCSTVLNTAGILGTLVVAAGQIGLTLHNHPVSGPAWPVLIFFLISLAYFGYSVTIALQIHGGIQGDLIDAYDLWADNPQSEIYNYNFRIAKTVLLYANYNWCLNNDFKYRLQSAQRAVRNGVLAVIVAGAISPWAVSPSTSAPGAPPQPTPSVSSHATASVQRTSFAPLVKD